MTQFVFRCPHREGSQGNRFAFTVNLHVAAPSHQSTIKHAVAHSTNRTLMRADKVEQLNKTEVAITGACKEWPDCSPWQKKKQRSKQEVRTGPWWYQRVKRSISTLLSHVKLYKTSSTSKECELRGIESKKVKKLQTRNLIPGIQPQNSWTEAVWMFTCAKSTLVNTVVPTNSLQLCQTLSHNKGYNSWQFDEKYFSITDNSISEPLMRAERL